MEQRHSYLGVGLYTYKEAGRILRTSDVKLRRWAEGYSSQGGARQHEPLFGRGYPELASIHILTFLDMIQLYLVKEFRSYGVSMQVIRATAERVVQRYNTDHPFAVMKFHLYGGSEIIGEMRNETQNYEYLENLRKEQVIMECIVRPFLEGSVDYVEGLASRLWPNKKTGGIVIDPQRSFGRPILEQYDIPTYPLYQLHRAGDEITLIAEAYRLPEAEVQRAITYEKELALVT